MILWSVLFKGRRTLHFRLTSIDTVVQALISTTRMAFPRYRDSLLARTLEETCDEMVESQQLGDVLKERIMAQFDKVRSFLARGK